MSRNAFALLFLLGCHSEPGFGDSVCMQVFNGEVSAEDHQGFLCVDVPKSRFQAATLLYFNVEGDFPESWTPVDDSVFLLRLEPGGWYECEVPSRVLCMEYAEYQQAPVLLNALGGVVERTEPFEDPTEYVCAHF